MSDTNLGAPSNPSVIRSKTQPGPLILPGDIDSLGATAVPGSLPFLGVSVDPPSVPDPSAQVSYRTRLLNIYQKYNPEKAAGIDALLQKYAGREEQLITDIVAKYDPEPQVAPGANVDPGVPNSIPAMVRGFLLAKGVNAADVAATAEAAIKKYPDPTTIMAALEPEYKTPMTTPANAPAANAFISAPAANAPAITDIRRRVEEFYAVHEPAKVSSVDSVLIAQAECKCSDEELMERLAMKYRVNAEGLPLDPAKRMPAMVRRFLLAKGVHAADVAAAAEAAVKKYTDPTTIMAALEQEYKTPKATAADAPVVSAAALNVNLADVTGSLAKRDEELKVAQAKATSECASMASTAAAHEKSAAISADVLKRDEELKAAQEKTNRERARTATTTAALNKKLAAVNADLVKLDQELKAEQEKASQFKKLHQEMASTAAALNEQLAAATADLVNRDDELKAPPSNAKNSRDIRRRIEEFYAVHEPANLTSVDSVLRFPTQKKCCDDELMNFVTMKYPGVPDPSTPLSYRTRLINIFHKYRPEKAAGVDRLLSLPKYAGREEQLIALLVNYYGPEPVPTTLAALSYRTRLLNIYQKYNPEKVAGIDALLQKCAGREEQLLADIVAKYGPEPQVVPGAFMAPELRKSERCMSPDLDEITWMNAMDSQGRIDVSVWLQIKAQIYSGGIQPSLRKEVWPFLLGMYTVGSTIEERDKIRKERADYYFEIKQQWQSMRPEQAARFTTYRERFQCIDTDIVRTDRSLSEYASEDSPLLKTLRHILYTYSFFNFDLGYCQGMTDIASPLLLVFRNEADAFWAFSHFMDTGLERNFHAGSSTNSMHQQFFCVIRLIQIFVPTLAEYLETINGSHLSFIFRWLLVRYKREFSMDGVMMLWEVAWSCPHTTDFHLIVAVTLLRELAPTIFEVGASLEDILRMINDMSNKMHVKDVILFSQDMYTMMCEQYTLKLNRNGTPLREKLPGWMPSLSDILSVFEVEVSEEASEEVSLLESDP